MSPTTAAPPARRLLDDRDGDPWAEASDPFYADYYEAE